MARYHHTQPGTLIRVAFGIVILVAGGMLSVAGVSQYWGIPMAVLAVSVLCLLLFHSLTVEVTDKFVQLRFGIGLIRKRFSITSIEQVKAVENRWYYGWGIRLTPHGWLFNVSGLSAVEIQLDSGRTYRIGTDQPKALVDAIQSVIAAPKSTVDQQVQA